MADITGKYGEQARGAEAKPDDLVYHTFFAEYKAATPEGIVALLHEESRSGTGQSMPEWWSYQQNLWKKRYNIDVPGAEQENAAARLIDILVKVGALEEGPKPPKDRHAAPGVSHG